jgi:hypothetical protein
MATDRTQTRHIENSDNKLSGVDYGQQKSKLVAAIGALLEFEIVTISLSPLVYPPLWFAISRKNGLCLYLTCTTGSPR